MISRIKIIGIVFVAALFATCEPVENRLSMGKPVTMADIDRLVTVELEVRDGKRSNYLIVRTGGLKALTKIQHGIGLHLGETDVPIQGFVSEGDKRVTLTVSNPDGSILTKVFNLNVEACFDVAPEWHLLCGVTGTKDWTWDDDVKIWGGSTIPYGVGGVVDFWSDWWMIGGERPNEGWGSKMTFSDDGAKIILTKSDGEIVEGTFSFDMTKTYPGLDEMGGSLGQLTVSIPILNGRHCYDDRDDVYIYDIITLDTDKLLLVAVDPCDWCPVDIVGDGWGVSTRWHFKAQ